MNAAMTAGFLRGACLFFVVRMQECKQLDQYSTLVFAGLNGKDTRMHGCFSGDMPVCILEIRFFLKKASAWLKIKVDGQMGREMYG